MGDIFKFTVVVLAIGSLAGCATSKEARELAIETAVALQALDVALSANAAAAKKAAASADGRIENLIRRTSGQRADLQTRIDADDSAKNEFDRLRGFSDKQEAERQKAIAAASAEAKALSDARQSAKSPSAALKEVSDSLTVLGREESVWDRLKSTTVFVRDVAKRVKNDGKAAHDEGNAASSAAKDASEKPDKEKFGK